MWDHPLGALATYKCIITIASCANIVSGFVSFLSSSPSIIYAVTELNPTFILTMAVATASATQNNILGSHFRNMPM